MRKFEFTSPNEEVEIAGETYTIDLSDDKMLGYQRFAKKAMDSIGKTAEVDATTANMEEVEKAHTEARNFCKDYLELVLGEGSFDKLYQKAGRSLLAMSELMTFLTETMGEKASEVKEKQKSKYVVKKG